MVINDGIVNTGAIINTGSVMVSSTVGGTSTTGGTGGGTGGTVPADADQHIVGAHMSGTSLILEHSDTTESTVLDVNSDTGEFDHFISGTVSLSISPADAAQDWASI